MGNVRINKSTKMETIINEFFVEIRWCSVKPEYLEVVTVVLTPSWLNAAMEIK